MTTLIVINGANHYISDEMRDRVSQVLMAEVRRCVRLMRDAPPNVDTDQWGNDGRAALALRGMLFSPEGIDVEAAWAMELGAAYD
jgi:hypothetical protein